MHTYVVSRPGIADGAAELDAALTRLRSFEETPHPIRARWACSYATRQDDGRFGLSCVFEADSVSALQQHARLTRLAAREILPVVATLPVRRFAPTMVYLVRRRAGWSSTAAYDESVALARRIGDEDMSSQVSWLRSYAVREGDGRLGSVCLYQAVSAEALREHAVRAGMPVDEITPVIGRIVFRDDPKEQTAGGLAVPA